MAKENILLPAMSDQMTEAELLSWKVWLEIKSIKEIFFVKFLQTK